MNFIFDLTQALLDNREEQIRRILKGDDDEPVLAIGKEMRQAHADFKKLLDMMPRNEEVYRRQLQHVMDIFEKRLKALNLKGAK